MPDPSLFNTCPACGEFIRAEVRECPACRAPLSAEPAAAAPSEGAALCASCLSPIPEGSALCPGCTSRPVAEPALAVAATPAAASPARASPAARSPDDARCPRCRSSVLRGAQRCPSCHFILAVDVVCEGAVGDSEDARRAAAAFSALGPPAPGMSEVMLAFSSPRPVLAQGASREWAQRAVDTLAQHGVTAFVSEERLAQEEAPPRAGSSTNNLALASLVVLLLVAGFFWKRHREAQRPQAPVHSFAAAAEKARAQPPAAPAPPPTAASAPAAPQAPVADAPRAAPAASPTAPAAAASAIGVLFREELLFGGHTADWWSKTLTELRGAADADRRALYPLAKARAERAGLAVTEEDGKVVSVAREEIVQKAHARRSRP